MRDAAVHFDSSIPDQQVTGESSSPSAITCSGSSQTDYRDVQSDLSESSYLALPTRMIPIGHSVRRTGCAFKKSSTAEHCRREEESQNMCNKRSERLNKPCKNGLCYCYTSDSDDIRQAAPSTSTGGDRGQQGHQHRCSSKPLRKQYMYNLPTESDSSAIVSSDQYFAEKLKAAQEKKKQRRVTLPPESLEGACKADAKSCRCGHKDKCRRQTFQATNKFKEFHCSDSDAPLIHIIQEVQRNMVVSEIRINRSKLKGKSKKGRSGGNVGGSGGNGGVENVADRADEVSRAESTVQSQENHSQSKTKHKLVAHPPKTDSTSNDPKNIRQSEDDGATSDLNSAKPKSSTSKGGRLLMKRVGADVTFKPSNGPPRKPPRNFSSSSDCSSIFNERIKTSSKRSKQKSLSSASSMISECEQPTMPANFLLNQPTPEPTIENIATKKASSSSLNTIPSTKPEIIKPALDRLSLTSISNKSLNSVASSKGDPVAKPTVETKDLPVNSAPSSRQEFTPSCPSYSEIATPNRSNINEMLGADVFPNVPTVPVVIQTPINELNIPEPRKSLTNSDYAKINFAATNDIPNIEAIGWIAPNIFNMLNTETANQKFVSEQPIAQPQQVGWEPPPKLQIDMVDSVQKGRETTEDFHNFAFNMACKSTPVKPDIPKDEVTPKNLLREKIKNSPATINPAPTTPARTNTSTKMTPVTEASRSDDEAPAPTTEGKSFQKRALRHTKSFLETSKNKIFGFGKRKEDRKTTPAKDPPPSPKTVATQTSESVVLHGRRLDFEYASDDTLNKRSMTPLGGEEITAEAKPTHHSDDGFDFNRTVNSPKSDRSSQRKQHNFSPRHILKNLQPNTEKIAGPEQSYRSYASDYNEDFTIAVQDLLGKARAKLEGEEGTSEIGRDTFTDESIQACVIAAQADIHNEPIYAEIHEQAEIQDAKSEEMGSEKSSIVYAKVLKRPKAPQPPAPLRPAPQPPTNPQSAKKEAPTKQPRSVKRSTPAPGLHLQQHPESSVSEVSMQHAIESPDPSTKEVPDEKSDTIQSLFQSPIWQNEQKTQSAEISKQPARISDSSSAPSSSWGSPIPELPSQEDRASPHAAQHTTWEQPTPEIPGQQAHSISRQQSSASEQRTETPSPEFREFQTPQHSLRDQHEDRSSTHYPQHSTWKQSEIPTQQTHLFNLSSEQQNIARQLRTETPSPEFQQFQTPHGSVQHSLRDQHEDQGSKHYPQHSSWKQPEIPTQSANSSHPTSGQESAARQHRTETSSPELQEFQTPHGSVEHSLREKRSTWKQSEIPIQQAHPLNPISGQQGSAEWQQFQTPQGSVQRSLREQHEDRASTYYPPHSTLKQSEIPTQKPHSSKSISGQQRAAYQQRRETPSPEQFQTAHASVQHSLRDKHEDRASKHPQYPEIPTKQTQSSNPNSGQQSSVRQHRTETPSPEFQQFQTPHGSVQHSLRDQHEDRGSKHDPQKSGIPTKQTHSSNPNSGKQSSARQHRTETPSPEFQQFQTPHGSVQHSLRDQHEDRGSKHYPQKSGIPTKQTHSSNLNSGQQSSARQHRTETPSPEFQQFQTPHGSVQHSLRDQHEDQGSKHYPQKSEIPTKQTHSSNPNSGQQSSARQHRTETPSPEFQQFQTPHGSVQHSLPDQHEDRGSKHYPQKSEIPTKQTHSSNPNAGQQSSARQHRTETPSPEFQQFQTPHGSVQHSLRDQHEDQGSKHDPQKSEIPTKQIHSSNPNAGQQSARQHRTETPSPEFQQFQTPHGSVQHSLREHHSTGHQTNPKMTAQQARNHQEPFEQHPAWQESQKTSEFPEYATDEPSQSAKPQLPTNQSDHSRYFPQVQKTQSRQRPLRRPPPVPEIWSSVSQGPPSPPQSSPSPTYGPPTPPHGHPRGPPSAPPSLASEPHGPSLPYGSPSPPLSPSLPTHASPSPPHGPLHVPSGSSQGPKMLYEPPLAGQVVAQHTEARHPIVQQPAAQYQIAEPQYKQHSVPPAIPSISQYPSAVGTEQHPTSTAGLLATPQHSITQYPLAFSPHTPSAPPFSPPGPQHPPPVASSSSSHGPSHTSTPGSSSSEPQQPTAQDPPRSLSPQTLTVEPDAIPSTSFNNCRERHSLPKARALSKSDLSQQGSEIFLENLYHMKNSNVSPRSDDEKKSNLDEPIARSQFFYYDDQRHGNSSNNSFSSDADSTKPSSDDVEYEEPCGDEIPHKMPFGYDTVDYDIRSPETASYLSCQSSLDKDENMNISPVKNLNDASTKSNNKYANLKFKIRASFRKGRNYLKNERKRLSLALDRSFSRSENAIDSNKRKSSIRGGRKGQQSDFEVDYVSALELLNETSKDDCVKRQLEQAVSICRQLPEFEASSEMVEAERLLLYSTLKENSFCKSNESIPSHHSPPKDFCGGMICITSFEIPIKPDVHYDAFFNYFYIGVFSNGQDIRSTQSAEKVDDAVFFPNCNMLFDNLTADFEINVDLYVLRLRKLSAPPIQKENVPVKIRKSSLSDSREEIVSRFRMHGNFIVNAQNVGPYEVKSISEGNITQNSEFSLIANNLCSMPINLFSRNINLSNEVWLTANVAYRFKNFELHGFLNVGDISRKHDWNKRWCQIDALMLYFWNYPQECSEVPPILTINLAKCVSYPIKSANREICPKPRSFQLNITNGEIIDDEPCTDTFLFSTENQEDFGYWVNGLNDAVEFIRTWKVQLQ